LNALWRAGTLHGPQGPPPRALERSFLALRTLPKDASMPEVAKLHTPDGKQIELSTIVGTEDERGLDIGKLLSDTGYVTLDEGFVNTGSTTSAITFLDGDKGILRYRGYPIEQLAAKCSFVEVSYLLLYGELPTQQQLAEFENNLKLHTMLHEDIRAFYSGFPRDAHPMAILSSVVIAMSTFYQDSLNPHDKEQVHISIIRLLAKLPTIAAFAFKKSIGQPYIYPDNSLPYCENFLKMMFAVPCEEYEIDADAAAALNLLLIVHADHEQNCSTSTVRMVGSSNANLFASISAGINALWGPLHGGANEACVQMLEQIRRDGGDVKKYVDLAKDKNSNYRLMGFGHRVYKNFDPRATLIKTACHKVLANQPVRDPIFDVALKLEEVALSDSYFIERKLYPNVDFYSGVIYRALGIPVQMFTVLFAIGRLPGWISHWCEMHTSPTKKICRPRQVYTGPKERQFVPMNKR
jgi:citrate synthase